ncbi:Cyclin-like F-box [Penicillium camemberti]|uniref:Cyclin-like F-box n=1 Tax=Penicillium camemberti (strain FM 013) TaxID=1429867 RepID=A0A0G4PRB3_PENC3|nr:Cyclin-like F-box [Penicillium camemberti]
MKKQVLLSKVRPHGGGKAGGAVSRKMPENHMIRQNTFENQYLLSPDIMSAIKKLSESTYTFLALIDHTLDDIESLCHLDNGHDRRVPCYGLGPLENVPLEILQMILLRLDIRSMTEFRRVNRRARLAVDHIPQYKQIVLHAPASIRGCLSLRSGFSFSCQDLYDKLRTAECDSCGDFGGYLYLVTCRRVCFLCFTEKADYLPLLRSDVIRKFGLRSEHLAKIPSFKSVPGRYSSRGIKCHRRLTLFDHSAAREAGIFVHGDSNSMKQYASESLAKRIEIHQSRNARSTHGVKPPRLPRSEESFDGFSSNPIRFMGIIRAPVLDTRTAIPQWGFHCTACKPHHYGRPLHWRRKFTKDSYRNHIRECGEIIDGKHKHE